jgi:K+-sensing histidine kinase KdpD
MGIHMITEQVEDIARSLLLRTPVRDPQELSRALAAELTHLNLIGFDEFAHNIDFSHMISALTQDSSASLSIDVAISGDIPGFFINKIRIETLFYNLLRSCMFAGATKVEIRCLNLLERWEFSVWDDGRSLSPQARSALLSSAYEVTKEGELRVGEVSLFIASQIVGFYEGNISIAPADDDGSKTTFFIPKE